MRFIFLLLFVALGSYCFGQRPSNIAHSKKWFDSTLQIQIEIPVYHNGELDLSYQRTLSDAKNLGLDKMESGFDSLHIRVWYGLSIAVPQHLLIIKRKGGRWESWQYELYKGDQNKEDKITSVQPLAGWDFFINQLLALGIMTLPNMTDIPGLIDGWEDGDYCNFEIATKSTYRYYSYHVPRIFKRDFWQAGKVTEILNLIYSQFK